MTKFHVSNECYDRMSSLFSNLHRAHLVRKAKMHIDSQSPVVQWLPTNGTQLPLAHLIQQEAERLVSIVGSPKMSVI